MKRKTTKPPKAPFRRGARLSNQQGRAFKVVTCENQGPCHHCTGLGIHWVIRLRGPHGIFETELDSIRRGGYTVVDKKTEERRGDDV
jgi:hypothetical protein